MDRLTQSSVETSVQPDGMPPVVTEDEARESSNAGMNAALILAAALSLTLLIWALLGRPASTVANYDRVVPNATHASGDNAARLQLEGDKSFVGGQAVQSDALRPTMPVRN